MQCTQRTLGTACKECKGQGGSECDKGGNWESPTRGLSRGSA